MKKQINKPYDQVRAGQRLREARLEKGLTAKQAAKKVNSTESTLCSYEIGRRSVNDALKVELANLYGKKVEEIFFK